MSETQKHKEQGESLEFSGEKNFQYQKHFVRFLSCACVGPFSDFAVFFFLCVCSIKFEKLFVH
jgi:hypothetical protein